MTEAVLSGKYEILAVLGRGGMADVSLAMARGPAGFNKLVVVKELRPELAEDAEHLSMFLSEARLGARLSHPAVVQIYEIDQDAGRLFITMEFLDGQPLHRVLGRLGRGAPGEEREQSEPCDQNVATPELPTALHLAVVAETLSGLDYAHGLSDYDGTPLGVVHRDVSPHNVFITYDGRVKLVDFGIAKGLDSLLDTQDGVVKGKAAYMAPEQAAGGDVDRRADVYSAGVMIWEALTGVRLFRGMHEVTVIARLMVGDIPSPRTVRPEVSAGLEAVCMRALAHDVTERYQTAAALRADLLSAMAMAGMVASLEEAGRLVAEAFAFERAELRETIARQLRRRAEDDQRGATSSYPSSFRPSSASGASGAWPQPMPTPLGFATSTRSAHTTEALAERASGRAPADAPTVPPPAFRRRRRATLAWLGVASAAVSLVIGIAWRRQGANSRGAGESSAASAGASSRVVTRPVLESGACDGTNKPLIELSGEIESDATLTCDKDYLLRFNVLVLPGVTLTILPGTVVKGDFQTKASLVVQPGARLIADGTETRPIVFTSERPASERRPGDWGGVILLGNAPTNLAGERGKPGRGKVEGIVGGGDYGGADEEDDSGVLRHVRIEYGGTELGPGNEVNGLTLAGVGRKTRIDGVEVRETTDDCFEFFGGTVDAKHLICLHGGDDAFDWDLGYRGRLQFLVFEQELHAAPGGNGFEGDNDPNGSRNEPLSAPQIYNATLLGHGAESSGEQYGVLVRRRTAGRIGNVLLTGFDAGVDVRDEGTHVELTGSLSFGNAAHTVAYPESAEGTGPYADDDLGFDEARAFLDPRLHNATTPLDMSGCFPPDGPMRGPPSAVTTTAVAPPDDGFFDPTARFVGAVQGAEGAQSGWVAAPWTVWSAR